MKVVGYVDRVSVVPGEKICFMVSCDEPKYHARIVRMIHGDVNPTGPGFKTKQIQSQIDGEYQGRNQKLRIGSYVKVAKNKALNDLESFTITAWVYPTKRTDKDQGLLTFYDSTGKEVGLSVSPEGCLSFQGDDSKLQTKKPMRISRWYFVAVTFDSTNGKCILWQHPAKSIPVDDSESRVEATRSQ